MDRSSCSNENSDPLLSEGIGELKSLTSLDLSHCSSLGTSVDSLPEGWTKNSDPASGKEFYHHAASGQSTWDAPQGTKYAPALPEGFGQLVNLKKLDMCGCSRVQTLPEGTPHPQLN